MTFKAGDRVVLTEWYAWDRDLLAHGVGHLGTLVSQNHADNWHIRFDLDDLNTSPRGDYSSHCYVPNNMFKLVMANTKITRKLYKNKIEKIEDEYIILRGE